MRVYSEMSLTSFQFWSGAKSNAEKLTYEELEQVDYMLEDIYSEGMQDTTINDLFWFDFSIVCEWLGYVYDEENDEVIREIEEDEE
jgi:hypothetical protein